MLCPSYHCVMCGSVNSLKCYRFFAKNVYMLAFSGFRVDRAAVTRFHDMLNRCLEAELVAHTHRYFHANLIKMDMHCCIPFTIVIRLLLGLTLELTNGGQVQH